ncbi:hypothetical protein J2T17_000064 [Paenibacillus mucilaginosus]|uniref:hypothetical protein n=1 Tax=Paenibacillus mucilaginosus TaxID=61624 RepID=UPI003D1D9ECC
MDNLLRKIFSLRELRYGFLLCFSIVICVVTFYIDEKMNPSDQMWLSISYYISFTIAAIWCGTNYFAQIRMNQFFRRQNDIGAYINQLALSGEDKLELQNYLEDYATDLEQHGRTREEAAKEAIDQFRVREFLSMSKHSKLFETHGHHYLLGYAALMLSGALVLALIDRLSSPSIFFKIFISVLSVYGVSFLIVYVMYKVLDQFIYEKIKKYFS